MVKSDLPTNLHTFLCSVLRNWTEKSSFGNFIRQFYLRSQQQSNSEIEDLEKLSLQLDSCLENLETVELTLTLVQLGINTEGNPDIVSNKRKLIRRIQKENKDTMENVDKQPE